MAKVSMRSVEANVLAAVRGAKESAREAGRFAVNPPFLQEKIDAATRVGQWMAALFIPIVVIVTLALITAIHGVLSSILGAGGDLSGQSDIFAFLVTGITLGMFIMAAWAWFQWVRTAGFGMLSWEE